MKFSGLPCVVTALIVLATGLASSPTAHASLHVTPAGPGLVASGPETSQAAINAIIAPILALAGSTELYKRDVDEANDVGTYKLSYATTFDNDPDDPAEFEITYVGGPSIPNPTHLLVKGGGPGFVSPLWYLFDITAWDGTSPLTGSDFWPSQGAISHVTLYGSESVIPEPGTILIWGTLGMAAVVGSRKWRGRL